MTNPTLEQRAREEICEDVWLSIPQYLHKSIIKGMLTFSHTGVEQAIEACAMDGWVMVPREPTEEMLARGNEGYGRKAADMASPTPTEFPEGGPIEYAWRAMCATAPAPDAIPLPAQSPDDIAYAGAVQGEEAIGAMLGLVAYVAGTARHVRQTPEFRDYVDGRFDEIAAMIADTPAPATGAENAQTAASPVNVEGLVGALKPFADLGRLLFGKFEEVLFKDEQEIRELPWSENGTAYTITYGDLRRARQFLASISPDGER